MGPRTFFVLAEQLLVGALLVACVATGVEREELARFEFAHPAMGTQFRVLVYAPDSASAERAVAAAFARVDTLDRALTDYDPESELSRLGARSDEGAPTPPIELSAELFTVLSAAEDFARASHGAFDVTVGPYVKLWRRARRQGELPDPARLAAAAAAVGFGKLELDRVAHTARLLAPGMRLDLGGIAKGYALDEALAVLEDHGLVCALVVGGGELRAGEPPPGTSGWNVELAGFETPGTVPRERLALARAALATSGDLEQALELDGARYSHILDPRTGDALTERRLVSVLGPRALATDALATALSVLGPEEGLRLAAQLPGVEVRLLVQRDGRTETFRTPGFPRLSCALLPPSSSP